MSLDTALLLVERSGSKYHVAGADVNDKVVDGDKFLVQRSGARYQYSYDSNWDVDIEDTDLLLVWESDQTKHITGAQFKTLFITANTLSDAQECHRLAYADYLERKILCESAYCEQLLLAEFEAAAEACYVDRGQEVPSRFIPPPRV